MSCPSSDASLANSGKDSDIPFPMSFYAKGLEGHIYNPDAG